MMGSAKISRALSTTWLLLCLGVAGCCHAKSESALRITTWNLQWFPNGSPTEALPEEQNRRIKEAADVLRPLNSDIILLQEVKNYDACGRLAQAIGPNAYHVAICSAFRHGNVIGKQQLAILSKHHAQAAWYELWKSMEGVDPPRGFAFAWFKIGNYDIGVYSLHLKANIGDTATNIKKREVAADQLLDHIHTVIESKMPMIKGIVVGGDFNTNKDQAMFVSEKTLKTLTGAGFIDAFGSLPLAERVTHPGRGGYPDATFDYLFGRNAVTGNQIITKTNVSDHFPVTCDLRVP
jgi:endonuclease/exonuclease/phosphatase family metal-dependent hydrolase